MSDDVILKIENLSKQYRLGLVGTGSLGHDLNRFWARVRGKEDPYSKVGEVNDRSQMATSDYVWALNDINFEVNRGEIVGIIGKNGAGKSTLLKILSRVTSPTHGSIKVGGRMASLLEVGTGMHPELTGRENIYLNGAILGMNKAEITSKIEDIIEFSGCQMYIDTPVKRYSSGMGVRLGFAVAAFLEPDILVVDEVLAVGDAEFQKKAIGKMQDISSSGGRTVLFVSHDLSAVKNLCNRVIVLKNGTSVFDGKTFEGIDYYLAEDNKRDEDLIKRTDRKGNQALRLKNIVMLDETNRIVNTVDTLQKIEFKFYYDRNIQIPIEKLIVSIQILNLEQKIVLAFPSDEFAYDFDTDNSKSFSLQLESLGLRPGNYYLNFLTFDSTTSESGFVDCIHEVFHFQVLSTNIKPDGRLLRHGSGAVQFGKYHQ